MDDRTERKRPAVCSGEIPVSDLKKIPGVGANMEQQQHNIGIRCIADLVGKDPEELYHLDCLKKGFQDDRCVLYVYRCAVYFAEHEEHEPEKLKWWYWKDKKYPGKNEQIVCQYKNRNSTRISRSVFETKTSRLFFAQRPVSSHFCPVQSGY